MLLAPSECSGIAGWNTSRRLVVYFFLDGEQRDRRAANLAVGAEWRNNPDNLTLKSETCFSLILTLMSCDSECFYFARSIKLRSMIPAWNSISPEWANGLVGTALAIDAELLPAADLSAPLLREAAVTLDGGGGPIPNGGAFATCRGLIDHPGVDEIPVGGAFEAIAATTISWSFVG